MFDVYFMTGSDNAAEWQDQPADSFESIDAAVSFALREEAAHRPESPADGGIRAWEVVYERDGKRFVVAGS